MAEDSTEIDRKKLTFAQAEGVEPLPSPLALKEISLELRALLWRVFHEEFKSALAYQGYSSVLEDPWRKIMYDRHTFVLHQMADEFSADWGSLAGLAKRIIKQGDYIEVFEFIQFFLRHRDCPYTFNKMIERALRQSRAAYTIIDRVTIFPIASEEEGKAIGKAFADLDRHELRGARKHLRTAGELLNGGDFAGSIRESIHAVESVARTLTEDASNSLGPALTELERKKAIHGGLKAGFGSIYGYTSDEKGIRHPLLDDSASKADIHDATFMLGACAAFVSYLVGRAIDAGLPIFRKK